MTRVFLAALIGTVGLLASAPAADAPNKKDQDRARATPVTITHIDAKKGDITVKLTDEKGKTQEKTFHLTQDVRILDETGRVVALDVFQSGNQALLIESAGKLAEVRRAPMNRPQRLSDAVRTLIEMSDSDPACATDVQAIYDMLRKLDANKDGKIDPKALRAEADNILHERVNDVFTRLDTNKDGKISRDEARGRIKEDFDKIDTNKDGFIERDELLKAAREKHEEKAANTKVPAVQPTEKEKK